MSTTEQLPTTEPTTEPTEEKMDLFEQLCQQHVKFFHEEQEKRWKIIPQMTKTYNMIYSDNTQGMRDSENSHYTALIAGVDYGYNSCASMEYFNLSKNQRLKLYGGYDAFHKFQPILLPGEKIEKATLFLQMAVPKEPFLKKLWMEAQVEGKRMENNNELLMILNSQLRPTEEMSHIEDWKYHEELTDKCYIPVKTISNINGDFAFFDKPFYNWDPYSPLSVEITYSELKVKKRKLLGVQVFTFSHDLHRKMILGQ